MKILDMSAGNRAIWFDKTNPLVEFCDCRPEVGPTVLCDTRSLPFKDSEFDLVVFDPPHVNFGANAEMSKTYGWHTTDDIRDIITKSSDEAWRVTRPEALMAFKWNDHDQKLEKVLGLMAKWQALFGHKVSMRTKHSSTTSWVLLLRRAAATSP
jgi:hypothetical protein